MSVVEEKEFVIKHVFTDFMKMQTGKDYYGKKEIQLNIPWRIKSHYGQDFSVHVQCLKFRGTDDWSVDAEIKWKLLKNGEEEILKSFVHYENSKTRNEQLNITLSELPIYLINGNLTIECHLTITKMVGIKEKLCNFDKSLKTFSDVVLIVNDEKFHVSKSYLAYHSSYFKTLFSGNFDESKQSEITLKDIDAYDFQNFLEVLHGEPAVDENTIDGILKLADMYDAKTAIRRCEEFSLNKSQRSLKRKFNDATKYKMDKLKKKCIDKMKSKDDIRSVMPNDASKLDASVWRELLDKTLSLK